MRYEKLNLKQDDFEHLWDIINRTRSTSKTCTVPKDMLVAILRDHGEFCREVWPGEYLLEARTST